MTMKASDRPPQLSAKAPEVVGKFLERVNPVTYARPAASSAIAVPQSSPLPPRNVEYRRLAPDGSSLTTKASPLPAMVPLKVWSNAPGVVGKVGEFVSPVT